MKWYDPLCKQPNQIRNARALTPNSLIERYICFIKPHKDFKPTYLIPRRFQCIQQDNGLGTWRPRTVSEWQARFPSLTPQESITVWNTIVLAVGLNILSLHQISFTGQMRGFVSVAVLHSLMEHSVCVCAMLFCHSHSCEFSLMKRGVWVCAMLFCHSHSSELSHSVSYKNWIVIELNEIPPSFSLIILFYSIPTSSLD